MRRFVNLVLLVGVVFFFGSAREALAQYATGPDGQYAGGVQASAVQKKVQDESGPFFSLEPQVVMLAGYTRYQIYWGGRKLSELEFPMDSALVGIGASIGKKGSWEVGAHIGTNFTEDTGKMKDSDWLDNDPSTKSVYSESDISMNAFFMDLSGKFVFFSRRATALAANVGYKYQKLDFDVSNTNQWCLTAAGCTELGSGYSPGKTLTYEMTWQIPYAGLSIDAYMGPRFSLVFLGAAGWAYGRDEDDHVLRGKRSSAASDGPYYALRGEGRFTLTQQLFLDVGAEYLKIDAKGKQNQVCYAAMPGCPQLTGYTGIDYKAKSEQTTVRVGLKYVW